MISERHIVLIGLSGSGKSAVGRLLAAKLKRPFLDLDSVIEEKTQHTITEIFKEKGEPAFRKIESRSFLQLLKTSSHPSVIALGGGAFESIQIRNAVLSTGFSVWLRSPVGELAGRLKHQIDRPLLKGKALKQILKRQLNKRFLNFRKADIQVPTARKTKRQVVTEIIRRLEKQHANN